MEFSYKLNYIQYLNKTISWFISLFKNVSNLNFNKIRLDWKTFYDISSNDFGYFVKIKKYFTCNFRQLLLLLFLGLWILLNIFWQILGNFKIILKFRIRYTSVALVIFDNILISVLRLKNMTPYKPPLQLIWNLENSIIFIRVWFQT